MIFSPPTYSIGEKCRYTCEGCGHIGVPREKINAEGNSVWVCAECGAEMIQWAGVKDAADENQETGT